jgi:MFS family permease
MPLLMQMKGLTAYDIGIIFSIQILSIALTQPIFGRLSDKSDRRIQIVAGLLLLGCSVAAMPFLSSLAGFVTLSIFAGLGMSFSTVATGAYVADIAKKEELGASMGALSSTMDIGHSFGPLVTGIIITSFDYTTGFMASLALSIAVSLFFIWSVFRKR